MIRILTILFVLKLSFSVQANDTIIEGLSSKNVSINTTFTGSDILIFGSIKRSNSTEIIPSNIIIEVLGPKTTVTVRKKKKMFGIWINSDPFEIYDNPSFYSLLYTKKPDSILSEQELENSMIGEKRFFNSRNKDKSYIDAVNANIRIKSRAGSYIFYNDPIIIEDDTLFSAQISLPANLTEGDYQTIISLVQNGTIVNSSVNIIKVRKVGLEKWLYRTAHDQPLFYGIFSIFLALFLGWSASSLFRRFQK